MRTIQKRHRDIQRAFPAGICALCGGELYGGEQGWRIRGRLLCRDCVVSWVLDELAPWREKIGEVGR